ncbi:MAG TPA: hypothetical protein VEQ18_01475 [Candidatus Nitrosocosmicus sp.]|nr:hypothetical protein [Candidatus Nitrosocosmicus sp.]
MYSQKKVNKKRNLSASNDFSESDVEYFLSKIKDITPFPKLRELRKILTPHLTLDKIYDILRYLERSNLIIIDLDGNIVWIKEKNLREDSNLMDIGKFSSDFLEYFGNPKK